MSDLKEGKKFRKINIKSAPLCCLFVLLILSFLATPLTTWGSPPAPRVLVDQAVRNYVLRSGSGAKVIEIGSWVKGKNKKYKNPLAYTKDFSDHDMTLVLPPGTDKKKALAEWKKARTYINLEIRRKLMAEGRSTQEIERVISSISIYPPQQLVGHPKTAKEAKAIFATIDNGKKLAPCLEKGAEVEGLFGPGDKAFRQAYEAKTGRVIYKMGNKVYAGHPNLEHMAEGYGKFTIKGSANFSEQFAEKVEEALEKGNAKDAGKNLERLKAYYRKTRSLTRVKLDGPIEKELNELLLSFNQQSPQTYTIWLKKNEGRIKKILPKVSADVELCKMVERANPKEIRVIRQILERNTSPWGKLFGTVSEKWRNMAQDIPWGKIVHGLNIMIWVSTTTDAVHIYQEKGLPAATNFLLKNAILANINLPASLTYSITEAMAETALKHVEAMGYSMVTRYQECDQLIAGIYMVKGREKVGEGMDIKELAQKYTEEKDVLKFVGTQAGKAANRGFKNDSVEAKRIEEIKKLLMAKCGAKIIQKWKDERGRMRAILLQAKDRLNTIIYENPIMDLSCRARIGSKGTHFAECLPTPAAGRRPILDALDQISGAIKALDGPEHSGTLGLKEIYTWKVDGKIVKEVKYPSIKNGASGSLFLNPGTQTKLLPLQAGKRHTIELNYQLVISPEFVVDTKLFKYCDKLKHTFSFKSMTFLNSNKPALKVTGMTEIPLGETLNLKAEITGISPSASSTGDTFKVVWFNGNDELPSSGMTLRWQPDAMGRYSMRAVLYRNGNRIDEHSFFVRVLNTGIVRDFYAVDARTGDPINALHVSLTGMDGVESQKDASGPSGKVRFAPLKAGKYFYRCSAPGYKVSKGDGVFKESGKTIVRMYPEKKSQMPIPGKMKIQALKLNHTEIVMGFNENVGLSATVVTGKGPYMVVKNVTSEIQWAANHPDIIVQTDKGIIVSGTKEGTCTIRARYVSRSGEVKVAYCLVTVKNRAASSLPVVEFDVVPEKPSYHPGELITFTQKINVKNPNGYYFIWYLDNKEKRGPSITHIFTEPGHYSVRLVVKSITTGREDALAKTISVEAAKSPSTPQGKPFFIVSSKPYSVGREIRFTAMNVPASFISYWVVKHRGKIKKIENKTPILSYTPQGEGKYGIAIVYFKSADDRSMHSLTRWVNVEAGTISGNGAASGIIASHINRFSMKKISGTSITQIQSSYWREGLNGKGYWTRPVPFERIAKTRNIILKTGAQSDGYNTGWVVFVPYGKNEIQFRVYHFDFGKHEGIYRYGGTFNLHGKTVDSQGLSFVEVHSRAAIIQWKATDGSIGRVRVMKYGYGGNSMITHGIKELFFTDAGGSASPQEEKHDTSWKKTMMPGVQWRLNKNERFEVKVAGNVPYILAEMRVMTKSGVKAVTKTGTSTSLKSGNVEDVVWKLLPGTHKFPMPSRKAAKEKGVKAYQYKLYSAQKSLIFLTAGRTGNNSSKLALDEGTVENQTIVKLLNYHGSNWAVRLKEGKLEVAGDQSHPRSWSASRWITLGTHIDSFTGVGTGQGPLVVYRKNNTWTAILLHCNDGSTIKEITKNEKIIISGGGKKFGATIKVGGRCYDFSSNNRIRTPEVDCKSHSFKRGELQ